MGRKKKIFLLILMVFILILTGLLFSGCHLTPPIPPDSKWTVMVYMASGNDLESYGIQDINEMELVGSTDKINIVVQMDRIPFHALNKYGLGQYDDTSNQDWTGTRRYYITRDSDKEIINSRLEIDLGEQNMGDPETLKDFTRWAIENYPAQKYMLILWNHGGGFRSLETARDICWDYNFGRDRITMPQLEEALSFTRDVIGDKIDIIGMDACFMSMIEVAYQIKDEGKVMVASQPIIPGDGWQYDCILQNLVDFPEQTPEQVASEMVNCYNIQYSGTGNQVSLSAIHLNQIKLLANQISSLAQAIMSDQTTPKSQYRKARNISQYFSGMGLEYIDIQDFVTQLPSLINNGTVLNRAGQVKNSMESGKIVISNTSVGSSVGNAHGLSIYFPQGIFDPYYNNTRFSQENLWDEMLLHLGY